jgi:uncharacterized surface protein with fasciclin (FAS1) repeats
MKKIMLLIASALFLMCGCEEETDPHYKKPEWLNGPLFDQIKSTGKYDSFVKAAEHSGYDEFLNSRQMFTVFVPTNEAFDKYLGNVGASSIKDLNKEEVYDLLEFHTLANAWDSTKMGGKYSWGYWGDNPNNFRTECLYQPPIYQASNKHVSPQRTFLLLFSDAYFRNNGFSAIDYETFYPETEWTGYNINNAAILQKEKTAENGFYYVIDHVMPPKTTADRVIDEHDEFSLFKKMADRFVQYENFPEAAEEKEQYDSLYQKSYALNFDLADDWISDNDPNGYFHVYNTAFVPTNASIESYFADQFPAFASVEDVPNILAKYFVEAHLQPNKKYFPSVLNRENPLNDFSDPIDYELNSDIISAELSSNAIIYGVDRVINSNAFETVSGPIIKNPEYRIFTMMLEISGEISSFFKQEIGHVVFVLSNEKLTDLGFNYYQGDPTDFSDDRIYRNNEELTNEEIKRFLENYVSITSKEVDGQEDRFIKTKSDQYFQVGGGQVNGPVSGADILSTYESSNGTVFELDQDITPQSEYTIEDYLNSHKSQYSEFIALCDSAGMLNNQGDLKKISVFSGVTLLLPNNEAVTAIKNDYIPDDATSETYDYKSLVNYMVISEKVLFTDQNIDQASYGTDLFVGGSRRGISVSVANEQITLNDHQGQQISITPGPTSNILTSNGVVHVTDKAVLY